MASMDEKIDALNVGMARLEGEIKTTNSLLGSYLAINHALSQRVDKVEGKIWSVTIGVAGALGTSILAFVMKGAGA